MAVTSPVCYTHVIPLGIDWVETEHRTKDVMNGRQYMCVSARILKNLLKLRINYTTQLDATNSHGCGLCATYGICRVGRNKMCCVGRRKQHSAYSTKVLNLTDRQNSQVGLKLNKRGRKII